MKHAAVMIGNSSSGIIESSSFKLPVVNVGMRQEGRERATNIIDVPNDKKKIEAAIKKATSTAFRKKIEKIKNPYGNGKTGEKIAKILSSVPLNKKLLQKKICY